MVDKWIQNVDMKKGALTKQAKEKGMSLDEYCAQPNLSAKAKKRCVLRKTLMKINK